MTISFRSSRSAWAVLLVGACSEEPGVPVNADGSVLACPLSIIDRRVVKLSTSGNAMMALFSDGTAVCWGEDYHGECAHPAGGGLIWPTVSPGIECAIDVSIDGGQGMAIWYDRTVRIFGSSFDTLDPIDPNYQFGVPIEVPGLRPVRSAVHNGQTAYVVLEDGSVVWWGFDSWVSESPTTEPTELSGLPPTRKISGGLGTICALTEEGEVWCWGATLFGQLGDATTKVRVSPARVEGLEGRRMVDVDVEATTCALQDSGEVFCLGENRCGELGRGYLGLEDGHPAFEVRPAPVIGLPPASAVEVGFAVSCALTREAEVYCWGFDSAGWDGESDGGAACHATPMRIPGGTEVTQFAAALDGICMLKIDGSVWCIGDGIMLGDGYGDNETGVAKQVDFSKTWECTASGDSCELAQ